MTKTRINLIPREALPQRGFRNEHGIVLLFTALFSYVLISLPLLSSSLKKKQAEVAVLTEANDKLKARYSQLSQEALPVSSEEEQAGVFRTLIGNRSHWGGAYQELTLLAIPNVWLNGLKSHRSDKKTLLNLKGLALSPTDVSLLFTALEKSYHFRNVRLKSTEELTGLSPRQFGFEFLIEIPELEKVSSGDKS